MGQYHDTVNNFFLTFQIKLFGDNLNEGNVYKINSKLTDLDKTLLGYRDTVVDDYVTPIFNHLILKEDTFREILKTNRYYLNFENSTLNVSSITEKFKELNINDKTTAGGFIEELNKIVDEIFNNIDSDYGLNCKIHTKEIIKLVIEFMYFIDKGELDELENKIDAILKEITGLATIVFELNKSQQDYLDSFLKRSSEILSVVNQKSKLKYINTSEKIFQEQKIKENLKKIESVVKKNRKVENKIISNINLSEFYDAIKNNDGLNNYGSIQSLFKNLRSTVSSLFNAIETIYVDYPHYSIIIKTFRTNIMQWLTIPKDFRENNWIEIIHVIVQNMIFSFNSSFGDDFKGIKNVVLPILKKIDAILLYINNEDFKLLITEKDYISIHHIDLPNLINNEDVEKVNVESKILNDNLRFENSPRNLDIDQKELDNLGDSINISDLNFDNLIEYLIFDDMNGATASMTPVLSDVIKEIYYREWFKNRLNIVSDKLHALIKKDQYISILKDLETSLLDKVGFKVGNFIENLISKITYAINNFINIVKEIILYIIDELLNISKAMIEFIQKLDFPLDVRNLLKKIAGFENLPDSVTVLHILAAIPYTLYNEFVDYMIPQPVTS